MRIGRSTGAPAASKMRAPWLVDGDVVAVLEIADPVGERADRQGVGAEEHLALAVADHQRRAVAGAQDQLVLAVDHHAERIGAASAGRAPPSAPPAALGPAARWWSIRWATTSVSVWLSNMRPSAIELGLQLGEVLDDAVVHQRHPAGVVRVGVARSSARRGWPSGCGRCRPCAVSGSAASTASRLRELALGPAALDDPVHHPGHAGRSRSRGTPAAAGSRSAGPATGSAPTMPMMPHMLSARRPLPTRCVQIGPQSSVNRQRRLASWRADRQLLAAFADGWAAADMHTVCLAYRTFRALLAHQCEPEPSPFTVGAIPELPAV